MHKEIIGNKLGLGEIISLGWSLYWSNFSSILPIVLFVYIPINIGLSLIPVETIIEQHGVNVLRMYMKLTQAIEFFIGIISTIAICKLIESSIIGKPITWQQALRHSLSRWGASITTGILASFILLGMTLLFIIPGIIWTCYYLFYVYVVAIRGLSGKRALDYSKAIVKGQWWKVFLSFIGIGLIGLLAILVVIIPFTFTPDHWIIEIISDTFVDIAFVLYLTISIVFFLNLDSLENGSRNNAVESDQDNPAWMESEESA